MLIGEIAARDRVSVAIDEKTDEILIMRSKFGKSEEDPDAHDIVTIKRDELPEVIAYLQKALNHDT